MSARSTILEQIQTVAAEQGKTLTSLTDETPLLDSGLDSLCFAILVSRLEDATGRDPFSEAGASRGPMRTKIKQISRTYAAAAKKTSVSNA